MTGSAMGPLQQDVYVLAGLTGVILHGLYLLGTGIMTAMSVWTQNFPGSSKPYLTKLFQFGTQTENKNDS